MKTIKAVFAILIVLTIFTSCDDDNVRLTEKQQLSKTTVELQQQAQADTNLYKVVINPEYRIKVLNKDTNIMVAEATNFSTADVIILLIVGVFVGFFIGAIVFIN